MRLLKKLAARLPDRWQQELKRLHFARQIAANTFATAEPEYRILDQLIGPGDWVVDIGANVGHYARRFSELVGAHGRVLAFEPVPTTFALLAANVQLFAHANVTLFNAAVSDKLEPLGMDIPAFQSGLTNYYEAHVTSSANAGLSVLALSLDPLCAGRRIALVKIDAEGHEAFVLAGMQKLLETQRPVLIVETGSRDIIERLEGLGYVAEILPGSPNILFKQSLPALRPIAYRDEPAVAARA